MSIFHIMAWAIILGAIYFSYVFIKRIFTPNGGINTSGAMICPNCGTRGEPKTITRGSIGIELVLWLCFLIPGLIYSIWRLTSKQLGCPSCGQQGMINISTPNGKLLVSKFADQNNALTP